MIFSLQKFIMSSRIQKLVQDFQLKLMQNNVVWLLMQLNTIREAISLRDFPEWLEIFGGICSTWPLGIDADRDWTFRQNRYAEWIQQVTLMRLSDCDARGMGRSMMIS